jgi:hypothetical protein
MTPDEYIDSLDMTLEEANELFDHPIACACSGCPPEVECRPDMCRCSLLYAAAKRVTLREKARKLRNVRQ